MGGHDCDLTQELATRFESQHEGEDRHMTDQQIYHSTQCVDLEQAREDLQGIITQLRRTSKRRATPKWS
eukprot:360243-Pyramimonas_sp.AAC.1